MGVVIPTKINYSAGAWRAIKLDNVDLAFVQDSKVKDALNFVIYSSININRLSLLFLM